MTPPPCDQGHFFEFRDIKKTFEKNFLNKKCLFIVGQHFGNIFLLRQQIATKKTTVKKLRFVAFGRSNKLW